MVLETSKHALPKPSWLKVRMPGGERHGQLKQSFRSRGLHTVCEEARCPNIGECWREGTATLMILGDVCTRGCRFCAVRSGNPGGSVDVDEPEHVGQALSEMDLAYVVLTMVDRDDLPDGGADHVARTVQAIRFHDAARRATLGHDADRARAGHGADRARAGHHEGHDGSAAGTLIETLVGDFAGKARDVRSVVERGAPDVFAHNVEVVPSLQRTMRDARCSWERSVEVLRVAREAGARVTKSSLMVGCGEQASEVHDAMQRLREADVDVITIGQYLRPTAKHAPITRYVEPEEFERYREAGVQMGFKYVASGPLVRSSYRAAEAFLEGVLRGRPDGAAAGIAPYSDRYGKRRLEVVT